MKQTMDENLNTSDVSRPQGNHSQWLLLGELTLSNETAGDGQIRPWLIDLLQPLSLPAEFVNRIARSASEAATRVLQSEQKLEHIHLKIHGPGESTAPRQTWGFFRVEKIENPAEAGTGASHAIEFYLYTEDLENAGRHR